MITTIPDTVYAVHNFEAENDDELTFSIGETVTVIQKDDGFNDGWWKGKNIRGEIGLFPMNYISTQPCHQRQQPLLQHLLPTPSTSDDTTSTKKLSSQQQQHINLTHIDTNSSATTSPTTATTTTEIKPSLSEKEDHYRSPSARSSYSFTCPTTTGRPSTSMSNHSNNSSSQNPNNNVLRRSVINTLFLPQLRTTSPEEWDIDQVETWFDAMNFGGNIATNFKSQEITGDILLELNMEALKELDVPTFGKRFKVHTAINVLREECGYLPRNSRTSIVSSSTINLTTATAAIDEQQQHQMSTKFRHSTSQFSPTISPTFRSSNPIYNRQSSSYHSSNFVTADTHYRRSRSQRRSTNSSSILIDDDDDDIVLIKSNIPSALTNDHGENYEDRRTAAPISPKNVITENSAKETATAALIQAARQRGQTAILPMAHRSSMDIYSTRTTDDNGNVTPDMEGWLFKQSCKYKKWNKRWFVLKGPNLFYFKSPKDVRMKGIINLRGYRIIPDETIQPGKYSFKAQHEEERTFYFYTDLDTSMKSWISSLMKATISRDFTAPVLSSSIIPTVSLDVARRMRPRPPSVLLYRKENLIKSALSPQSYEATYGGFPHSPPVSASESHSSHESLDNNSRDQDEEEEEELTNQDSGFDSDPQQPINNSTNEDIANPDEEEDEEENETEPLDFQQREQDGNDDEGHFEIEEEEEETRTIVENWNTEDYIQWVNSTCHHHSTKITKLSELRQGEVLIELLEQLCGKKVKVLPPSTVGSISMLMLDNIVAVFKFMSMEGIEMEDRFTIKDIFSGREDKIKVMLHSIFDWSMQYKR